VPLLERRGLNHFVRAPHHGDEEVDQDNVAQEAIPAEENMSEKSRGRQSVSLSSSFIYRRAPRGVVALNKRGVQSGDTEEVDQCNVASHRREDKGTAEKGFCPFDSSPSLSTNAYEPSWHNHTHDDNSVVKMSTNSTNAYEPFWHNHTRDDNSVVKMSTSLTSQ
jgi:hypothetical protein